MSSDEQTPRNGGAGGSKTGRKGDPRMHRAVAARLADPNLSLFDALRIGGFNYPTDDDSSCIDSENVKLGQRKNQLSRRVRMARRQVLPEHSGDSGSSVTGAKRLYEDVDNTDEEDTEENAAADSPDASRPMIMAKFHPDFHPIIPKVCKNRSRMLKQQQPPMELQPQRDFETAQQYFIPAKSSGSLTDSATLQQKQQQQQQHAPPPSFQDYSGAATNHTNANASGVAVAALSQTAASAGLTLEQLALVLQNHKNLSSVLRTCDCSNSINANGYELPFYRNCKDLAMAFYKSESRILYEKAMLQAGFSPEQAREGSKANLSFAWDAWQQEGQRLQQLLLEHTTALLDPPLYVAETNPPPSRGTGAAFHRNTTMDVTAATTTAMRGAHIELNHSALNRKNRSSSMSSAERQQLLGESRSETGSPQNHSDEFDPDQGHQHHHHVHRLEGKCGHKAILHQPPDGEAHIDFVIGDFVECYQGMKPISQKNGGEIGVWPSKYKCEDLSCTDQYCSDFGDDPKNSSSSATPHIYHLKEINLDGKEWIPDFTIDEPLVALFRLGENTGSTGSNG